MTLGVAAKVTRISRCATNTTPIAPSFWRGTALPIRSSTQPETLDRRAPSCTCKETTQLPSKFPRRRGRAVSQNPK